MNKIHDGQKIVKETEPDDKLCQLEFNFVAVGFDHPTEDFLTEEKLPIKREHSTTGHFKTHSLKKGQKYANHQTIRSSD